MFSELQANASDRAVRSPLKVSRGRGFGRSARISNGAGCEAPSSKGMGETRRTIAERDRKCVGDRHTRFLEKSENAKTFLPAQSAIGTLAG